MQSIVSKMLVHLFKDPRLIVAPVPFEVHILEHAVRDNEVDPDRLLLCPLCPQVCAKADRQQAAPFRTLHFIPYLQKNRRKLAKAIN